MGVKPRCSFETNRSSATVQVWDVEGADGRAVNEEGDIAQLRDRHHLFEIFPSTVFLAEGKDGQAHWE